MRTKQHVVAALAVACLGMGSASLAYGAAPAGKALVDGVAAFVNGSVIRMSEVMTLVAPVRRQLAATSSGQELAERSRQAYRDALDTLVDRRVIVQAYEKAEFKIPDWVFDRRVEEITRDSFQGDRGRLMDALARDHVAYSDWRDGLREHIIVSYMRRFHVEDKVRVAPAAVREAYDRDLEKYRLPAKVKLSLIMVPKGDTPAAESASRQRIEDARRKAVAGEDFAALARAVSADRKAAEGGDWGWVEPRILRAELAAAAAALAAGAVSGIIETDKDFYLLKAEGRQEAALQPFDIAQPRIESELRKQQSDVLYGAWVQRLRDKAFIKIVDVDVFGAE